jgi:hypothetical protein
MSRMSRQHFSSDRPWEPIIEAPALIDPEMLVEIEADATIE